MVYSSVGATNEDVRVGQGNENDGSIKRYKERRQMKQKKRQETKKQEKYKEKRKIFEKKKMLAIKETEKEIERQRALC